MAGLDTIFVRLQRWTAETPHKRVLTFLDDAGAEAATVTYQELEAKTRALAVNLLTKPQGSR